MFVQKIIGVEHSQGLFKEKPYNNVNFYTTTSFTDGKGVGLKTGKVKVKMSALPEIFGKPTNYKDVCGLLNSEVVFYYDEYQNVNFIREAK